MKKINLLIIFLSIAAIGFTQKIDPERMERDIEVAENILATLMKQKFSDRGFFFESVEGNYLEDYGVIFNVPNSSVYVSRGMNAVSIGSGNNMTVDTRGDGYTYTVIAKTAEEAAAKAEEARAKVKVINIDSMQNAKRAERIEVMKLFIADYGNLISQLQPSQKILITTKDRQFEVFDNNRQTNEFTVEAMISDINDYKQGKINREQMMDKIIVTDRKVSDEKSTDLELLSSIFERLYRSDLSNTYYTHNAVRYSRLSDFGVIYKMKVYSSTGDNDNHSITTRKVSGLTREQRDNLVKEMYPEFIKNVKENILDYGKTISSIKNNEMLVFQIELTKCTGCDIPKVIELSVKNEILQQYSAGKISKSEALKRINLKEEGKQ